MPRRKRSKFAEHVKTLLQMYETFQNEFPEKVRDLEEKRHLEKEKLFGKLDDDPQINELHKMAEKKFHKSQDIVYDGPPLLHLCLQYAKSVKQSRYEASVFSNIISAADTIVDQVTGDDDDESDHETLIDVGHRGSIGDGMMSGLGLAEQKKKPELRIVVVKVTNIDKICADGIKMGRVSMSYEAEKKPLLEKSLKKEPDHRRRIGFSHVFNCRGLPIEDYDETDIKIVVKLYTHDAIYKAYTVLSPRGCQLGEVDFKFEDKCETDTMFWNDYIVNASEQIVEKTLPLICCPPETAKKPIVMPENPLAQKKKKIKSFFS